ncbi:hypothetical protein [Xanthobacter sp. 126]|uniref:hypothetical protein n=1 Tax=Xanthobacter sp. 126 TaxID=1131814 RepID=UPI001FD87CA2|nr:hypothetical protein [Xanthobacter sp. 126]
MAFSSLHIHCKLVACAHACRYCSMGKKTLSALEPERLHALLARFLEWEAQGGLRIGYVVNYTDNFDRRTLELLHDLARRFPRTYEPLRRMSLGGQPLRTDQELKTWLAERRAFGCISAHGSLAGTGPVHDHWNGQKGNFDLILRTLRMAGEMGFALGARLFVARSTLTTLKDLNDLLDTLPMHPGNWRYAMPFFYAGWAAQLEEERIDEAVRDSLPDWLLALMGACISTGEGCRSEREWIELLRMAPDTPERGLVLNVNAQNIAMLEQKCFEEIVSDLAVRTQAAYAAIPSAAELCERYGDRSGTKVYGLARCLEMKWLDRHLADHPMPFERALTHLTLS